MPKTEYQYKFACLFDWLTPLYDLVRWLGIRNRLQKPLWPRVKIKPDSKVLDVGCGTGDDLIYLATYFDRLNLTGIDGDLKVLAIAKNKAKKHGLKIKFQASLAERLPFPANSFDVVWSSLMIHHLPTKYKLLAFQEMYRALKPGGQLYLIEFGQINRWLRLVYWLQAKIEPIGDHFSGKLPGYIRQAGFKQLKETKLLFHVSLFHAVK